MNATDGDLDIIGVGLTPTILLVRDHLRCRHAVSSLTVRSWSNSTVILLPVHIPSITLLQKVRITLPSTMFKRLMSLTVAVRLHNTFLPCSLFPIHRLRMQMEYMVTVGMDSITSAMIWLEMMFIEGGSVKHTLLDTGFGVGCTQVDVADSHYFLWRYNLWQ